MFAFRKKINSVLGRMPPGHRPCYRCQACRTCKGRGELDGAACQTCLSCPKCDGNRVVPEERIPVEDAEAILARFHVLKRPMLEHVAFFLRDQPEGDVVFERLFEKRVFRLANGTVVRIKLERIEKGKEKAHEKQVFEPSLEHEATDPIEVPAEVPS